MSHAAHCMWSSLHKLLLHSLQPCNIPPPFYNMETEAQEDKVTKITQSVRDRLMARRHKLDFQVFRKESFFLEVVYSLVATESL